MKTKDIAFYGIFSAIILLLSLTPSPWGLTLGFVRIGLVEITFIHVIVIVGALFKGRKAGVFLGTVFGLSSMLASFIYQSVLFTNPIISVLPRIIFGLGTGIAFDFVKNIISKYFYEKRELAAYVLLPITAGLTTLFHTVIVLSTLYFDLGIFKTTQWFVKLLLGIDLDNILAGYETVWVFIKAILLTNGLIEILLSIVIVIPVVTILFKARHYLDLGEEDDLFY
jgi:uncharacterized membrane protein